MSFIDVTGKTEEEAIRKALEQLQKDRDDVSVEILERAKSGFLGIGSSPAKVRVTYADPEPGRGLRPGEKGGAQAGKEARPAAAAPQGAAPAKTEKLRKRRSPPHRSPPPRRTASAPTRTPSASSPSSRVCCST